MKAPQRYKALDIDPTPDPFTGKRRVREGYYYKHEGPLYAFNEGQPNKDKHFLLETGFADWNMTRQMEAHEIDIDTLEEIWIS